ncbi:MAG: alcohol dehydrogenase catalytic domain-containing protein, partial [Pseudomonadota bacterium]
MRAILQTRYGGPDDLILTDLPLPEPARGEVRVRVRACGVNLSDWEGLTGSPFYARLSGGVTRLRPRVLGSDIIGEVTALGPGVEGPVLGTRVLADVVMAPCGFAEYACLPVKALARVPDDLSDDVAASLPQPGPIAMAGTRGLGPGDRLLINGAGGGAGQLAVALAKATGAHVTAVDR